MPIVDPNDPQVWDVHPDRAAGQWSVGTGFYLPGSGPNWREVRVGYIRALFGPDGSAGKEAAGLIKSLNLTAADRAVLVGDNFGWVAEAFAARGINAVAADNGAYSQTAKDQTETAMIRARIVAAGLEPDTGIGAQALAALDDGGVRARVPVLDEGMATNGSRDRVSNALGGDPTWAVTMGVATWATDAEMVKLSADLHKFAAEVAHVLTPYDDTHASEYEPDPVNNWKRISEDQALTNKIETQPWFTSRSWKALLPDDWIVVTGSYNAYF